VHDQWDAIGYGAATKLIAAETLVSDSLARSMRQMTDQFAAIQPIKFDVPRWIEGLSLDTDHFKAMNAIFEPMASAAATLAPIFNLERQLESIVRPVASFATKMAPTFVLMRQIETMNKGDWIAHPALPVGELVGDETDAIQVGLRVTDYVEENHEAICDALHKRFSSYDHDDDAKAFAIELIKAYRSGLYRLIVPAVFPEIERCARGTLGLGAGNETRVVFDTLNRKLGNLPISKIGSLHAMFALFMLDDYFYKSFRSDSEAANFGRMIHRHGSQHGLLRYNESRDCLTAIFLFDFILLGCAAIRDADGIC
jgi:hypothetical protein